MTNNRDEVSQPMQAMQATDECNSAPMQQPLAKVPGHVLRMAIAQAERAADELDRRIKEQCGKRDNMAREVGAMQAHIDSMKVEHNRLTRHVRDLLASVS